MIGLMTFVCCRAWHSAMRTWDGQSHAVITLFLTANHCPIDFVRLSTASDVFYTSQVHTSNSARSSWHPYIASWANTERLRPTTIVSSRFVTRRVRLNTATALLTSTNHSIDRPIADYAKSTLEVANYHMHNPGGNLHLARELLAVVAQSNAEDVDKAQEMLKEVNEMLQARQVKAALTKLQVESKVIAAGESHERMDTR